MKFSKKWLEQILNINLDTDKLLNDLTSLGFEVDSFEKSNPNFTGVKVGKVVNCIKHPDADKLRVTKIDIGLDENLQIVCGAPNCREGLYVAVSTVGAILPGDFKIKKSKLRGEISEGMLCSIKELGLGTESDGILELSENAKDFIGQDFITYYNLDDLIIDIDITPNRGDMLSMRGIAREIASLNNIEFKEEQFTIEADFNTDLSISIESSDCSSYSLREIKDLDLTIKTPNYIIEALRRSGIKSSNILLDILSYTMLRTGQPIATYDISKISGSIVVQNLSKDEVFKSKDEKELTLKENDLVVKDSSQVISLAGICESFKAKVDLETTSVILEASHYTPSSVANKARNYDLITDSSFRFERGVDSLISINALEFASRLIKDILKAKVSNIVTKTQNEFKAQEIILKFSDITGLLGKEIEAISAKNILLNLGFNLIEETQELLKVSYPSWRFDISLKEDLIEEIARVYGYANIESKSFDFKILEKPSKKNLENIKDFMLAKGFDEIITYSFIDPKSQEVFNTFEAITLLSPISQNMSSMRTSLFQGMIKTIDYNSKRQNGAIKIFEIGQCFQKTNSELTQDNFIGFALGGKDYRKKWYDPKLKEFNFFDLSGVISDLNHYFGLDLELKREEFKGLHIGQSAGVYFKENLVGRIGKIHPLAAKTLNTLDNIFLGELNLNLLKECRKVEFSPISIYPSINRDFAFIVDNNLPADDFIKVIDDYFARLSLNSHTSIFDVYKGSNIPEEKKSLALSINFGSNEKTLEASEITTLTDDLIELLSSLFSATLRDE
ncbi:MAG: phenylalanine--tRNA ligase subunit beta [Psittacicella sp.]